MQIIFISFYCPGSRVFLINMNRKQNLKNIFLKYDLIFIFQAIILLFISEKSTTIFFTQPFLCFQVVKYLIEKHADVNKKGRDSRGSGATALHLAVEGGYEETVKALVEAHCNVDEVRK